jgi:hypothetical protein
MPNPAQTAATVTPVRAADIVWTAALIGAFYLAKTVSRAFGFHLPGSSMVLWLVPVLVARWRLDRPGSAVVVSLGGGIIAALPRWISSSWLIGYAAAALPVELLLMPLARRMPTVLAFATTGLTAGLLKAACKLALPFGRGVSAYSPAGVLLSHLLFGALAGLAAFAVCRAAKLRS